jgi:citrate lyase subunit beta/citryl-CoA lyase
MEASMSSKDVGILPPAFLYVPADRPERFDQADAASPAVILDLEDSVAVKNKSEARANVTRHLDGGRATGQQWVRVSNEFLDLDLDALISGTQPAGIMVAKADLASLSRCEDALPDVPLLALIETAAALDDLRAMAAIDTLVTFAVGEVDLLADLRISRSPSTTTVIDTIRLEIVRAAAAAGLHAPVAPTSLEVHDTSSLRQTTTHLRDLGFRSRTAIHPVQCPVIIEVLTPTPDQISVAQAIVDSFAGAGGGVAVGANDRLIDAAVVRESQEILNRASGLRTSKR